MTDTAFDLATINGALSQITQRLKGRGITLRADPAGWIGVYREERMILAVSQEQARKIYGDEEVETALSVVTR